MKIFAAYFVFLSIIIAGCASITSEHTINNEGIELEDEAMMDQEHKKNIEELELQQSELLEGLLEEESVTESISEISDDSEQYTNEEIDAEEDSNQLLAITEEETEEVIETEPIVNEIASEEEKKLALAAADLFCSPADNLQETFGLSVLEAMASSSTSVQNQIGEATRAVNDSTERLQGIRRSIENILGSMQMLSKSVDQTRRHLEGNISILGEVDRAVNQLQETATGTVTATAEIADNIRNVDSNTQTALRMSTEASTKAESGVEAFKESMAAIQRIRTNSDESANSIRFLSEKTESIEHILDVIDDISNRTRLLSLNASIIASHAGEAGRGFMIVADEIKDLASRTAGSTREIAKIINEVRDGSEGAIEVVERGVRAVNEGVKRAEFAGEVLSQIVASTSQTGNLVERISSAMNRQAAGTKQVSNAMREVHSVVIRVREVVGTQKNESRDLEASIRTMRIQMSRATATAKQQMSVIQEAIKAISFIFQQIQLISNFNTDQVRNQQSVSKAVDKLKHLSDLHHASADNLSMAVEQSNRQSKLVRDGLKSFRLWFKRSLSRCLAPAESPSQHLAHSG